MWPIVLLREWAKLPFCLHFLRKPNLHGAFVRIQITDSAGNLTGAQQLLFRQVRDRRVALMHGCDQHSLENGAKGRQLPRPAAHLATLGQNRLFPLRLHLYQLRGQMAQASYRPGFHPHNAILHRS